MWISEAARSVRSELDLCYCADRYEGVAVSGGPDSMALALLLKDWSDRHSTVLSAFTVDHGLVAFFLVALH